MRVGKFSLSVRASKDRADFCVWRTTLPSDIQHLMSSGRTERLQVPGLLEPFLCGSLESFCRPRKALF